MQDALVTLIFIVVALGAGVALYAVATSGRTYREIGMGGLDTPATDAAPPAAPETPSDREEEIRELVEVLDARRASRGEPPLDVEGHRPALAGAAAAGELRDELRALVEARNRRRARTGLEPLDVEAEIERRLRELN